METYKYAYKYRDVRGGYRYSCPSQTTQTTLKKIEITLRSSDLVGTTGALSHHRQPSLSKKTSCTTMNWKSSIARWL